MSVPCYHIKAIVELIILLMLLEYCCEECRTIPVVSMMTRRLRLLEYLWRYHIISCRFMKDSITVSRKKNSKIQLCIVDRTHDWDLRRLSLLLVPQLIDAAANLLSLTVSLLDFIPWSHASRMKKAKILGRKIRISRNSKFQARSVLA